MRVFVISRGLPTGDDQLGIFEHDQALALSDYGHEVVFCALDVRSALHRRKWGISRIKSDGMTVLRMNLPVGRVPRFVKKVLGRLAFARLMRFAVKACGKPDIVHAHFADNGVYAGKYCKKHGYPLVVTEHWSVVNKQSISNAVHRWVSCAYKNASELIAVSEGLARNIKRHTGHESVCVPNTVRTDEFSYTGVAQHEGFVFVATGNLLYGKGFDVLLSAFAIVCERYSDTRLVIIGGGTELSALLALSDSLNLTQKVSFVGTKKRCEIEPYYKNADAFVLASRSETFGVVYVEAMACGLPVIATRCGGPEGFVTDECGLTVEVNSVDELARAMIDMHESIGAYDREAIAKSVSARFSPESIARQITVVYEEALNDK